MMKKYNKPEIVTLALDMVDVIETSGELLAEQELNGQGITKVKAVEKQIIDMNDQWAW